MARVGVSSGGATKRMAVLRQSTGSIAGATTALVLVALPTAMASTNYTVVSTLEDASGDMRQLGVASRTTTDVTVRVQNQAAVTARTGTLNLVVIAD